LSRGEHNKRSLKRMDAMMKTPISHPAPRNTLEKPTAPAVEPPVKKPYHKPKLTRLGQLKSVAGSGLGW